MAADPEAQEVVDVESEPDDPYNELGSDLGEWDVFLFLSKLVLELLNVTFEYKLYSYIYIWKLFPTGPRLVWHSAVTSINIFFKKNWSLPVIYSLTELSCGESELYNIDDLNCC